MGGSGTDSTLRHGVLRFTVLFEGQRSGFGIRPDHLRDLRYREGRSQLRCFQTWVRKPSHVLKCAYPSMIRSQLFSSQWQVFGRTQLNSSTATRRRASLCSNWQAKPLVVHALIQDYALDTVPLRPSHDALDDICPITGSCIKVIHGKGLKLPTDFDVHFNLLHNTHVVSNPSASCKRGSHLQRPGWRG